ncbi:MAG: hypothetical protein FGM24_00835 [Candidatus Kapabacteria bacterium]|nr:hypothetical protein [Candidatus Kapabacteria bacterium]
MRFRITIFMLFLSACGSLVAQTTVLRGGKVFVFDTTKQSILIDARGGLGLHLASDLRCLDDGNCKPFQGGLGTSFGLSLGFEQEIDTTYWWLGMVGLDLWSGSQTVTDESARVRDANNNVVPLVRDLTLESKGMSIDVAGGVQMRMEYWRFWAMPFVSIAAESPTWSQTATIRSPAGITYPNGSTVDITVPEAPIPDAAVVRVGLRAGVGRDVSLEPLGVITPAFNIAYSPMSIRAGTTWSDLRATLGATLRINVDDLPDTVDERREVFKIDTIMVRRTGPTDDDYVVQGAKRFVLDTTREGYFRTTTETMFRTDTLVREIRSTEIVSTMGRGNKEDKMVWRRVSGKAKLEGPVVIDTLNVEKLDTSSPLSKLRFDINVNRSESIYMVLPTIFFDSLSATIPSRYRQLRTSDISLYRETDEATAQDAVYHDVLNVIGSRVKSTNAPITIRGYIDAVSDSADCELSLRRAISVRSYLVYVWGIDSNLVSVEWNPTDCQPEVVSTSQSPKAQEERRRVTISSTSPSLYLPILRMDQSTSLVPAINQVKLDGLSLTDVAIKQWAYKFERENQILWSREGTGIFSDLDLSPAVEATRIYRNRDAPVVVTLTLITEQQDTLITAIQMPTVLNQNRQKIKRLSLATFDIRSSSISDRDQGLLKNFMDRLDKGDKVEIIGYSDDLGERDANLRLSQRRAETVADIARKLRTDVSVTSVVGKGSSELPVGVTDYNRPENRFLSRIVQLRILD